jgi:hypothetical protein
MSGPSFNKERATMVPTARGMMVTNMPATTILAK